MAAPCAGFQSASIWIEDRRLSESTFGNNCRNYAPGRAWLDFILSIYVLPATRYFRLLKNVATSLIWASVRPATGFILPLPLLTAAMT